MKLLFDANLSRKLVALLADVFAGSVHASVLGTDPGGRFDLEPCQGQRPDDREQGQRLLPHERRVGAPPKVVWLRIGNGPTRRVESLLRSRAANLEHFLADASTDLLIIEQS